MKTKSLLSIVLIFSGLNLSLVAQQGVAINTTGEAPHVSAILDVNSNQKGMLIPRMDNARMNDITDPAIGLLIYNTDLNCFYYRNLSGWQKIISEANATTITDGDGDSYLSFLYESSDDDTLRIFFNYLEKYKLTEQAIEILNNGQSVFIGEGAGRNDDGTDNRNTFVGYFAGNAVINNTSNTGIGHLALKNNTGNSNTAIGRGALQENTTGWFNTAVGAISQWTGTGSENSSLGYSALSINKGYGNTAMGFETMRIDTSGGYNTAIGSHSMRSSSNGSFNTALGNEAMYSSWSSSYNVAVGNKAMYRDSASNNNTAVGSMAGYDVSTGNNNIFLGYYAGKNLTSGGNNIIIGYDLAAPVATGSNQVVIGSQDLFYGNLVSKRIGIGTATPAAQLHINGTGTGEGNVLCTGSYKTDSPGDPPVSGAGTRMMWYPDKAAFRAGYVNGTQWDKDSIGAYSTATGSRTIASGMASIAMGLITTASGDNSIAMGVITTASGFSSTAIGYHTTASGANSTAIGSSSTASGGSSTAMGEFAVASGFSSTAIGQYSKATGSSSTALGFNTTASGNISTAMGDNTTASGDYSTAMGYYTKALSSYETVIGRYNTLYMPDDTLWGWIESDRLFVIGNGTQDNARSNAMTVLKNGKVGIGNLASNPEYLLSIGDSTTGIDWPAGNTLSFNTNGNERMRIAGNGNISIGSTSTGSNRLKVVSAASGGTNATGSFENTDPAGLAFRASTNSSDGTLLSIQEGAGYSLRCDGYDPNWFVAMIVKGRQVGINTSSPTQNLDVNGNARFRSIGSGAYSGPVNRTSDGTLTTATSDIRLKTNVQTLEGSLDKVQQLRGVSFTWIDDPGMGTRVGMIAQEVEKVCPELVFTNEADGYKGVNYAEVSAVLIEAMKEQQAMIEQQQMMIEAMRREIEEMKTGGREDGRTGRQ